jgi:hypothetical protein
MAKDTRETVAPEAQTAAGRPGSQPVNIDTSNLKSSYCNVCNASSTREEVVLNFGVNQNWDLGQKNLEVQLLHRIILSPFAAKRLQEMLNKLISEHEARYGELK